MTNPTNSDRRKAHLSCPRPRILSIQSQVVHGHVGNSAALFPMQLLGCDVAAVPTVLLSNHPHYPDICGGPLDAGQVRELLEGAARRGYVGSGAIILTGYLGSTAIALEVAQFIARAKQAFPDILYCCDPVMGDVHTGLYVEEALVDIFRDRLLPLADIITPNQYECGLLAGRSISDLAALQGQADRWRQLGIDHVIATSCHLPDVPAGVLDTIHLHRGVTRRLRVPRLDLQMPGCGDVLTGMMMARIAKGLSVEDALRFASASMASILEETRLAGGEELAIAGSWQQILAPPYEFEQVEPSGPGQLLSLSLKESGGAMSLVPPGAHD